MDISKYKDMSIGQIEKQIDNDLAVLVLSGGKESEDIAKMVKIHGNRAGAVMVAAHLFMNGLKNGNRSHEWYLRSIEEAAYLWRDAAKVSNKKKNKETVLFYAEGILDWLAYSISFVGKEDRKSRWTVNIDELSPDELFSLGNLLIYISIRDSDIKDGLSTTRHISLSMAVKYLTECNKRLGKC